MWFEFLTNAETWNTYLIVLSRPKGPALLRPRKTVITSAVDHPLAAYYSRLLYIFWYERYRTIYCTRLDEEGCLNLEQTLGAFTAPITEQHAWALAYMVSTSHLRLLTLCMWDCTIMESSVQNQFYTFFPARICKVFKILHSLLTKDVTLYDSTFLSWCAVNN